MGWTGVVSLTWIPDLLLRYLNRRSGIGVGSPTWIPDLLLRYLGKRSGVGVNSLTWIPDLLSRYLNKSIESWNKSFWLTQLRIDLLLGEGYKKGYPEARGQGQVFPACTARAGGQEV